MAIATHEVLAEKVAEQAPHLPNKNLISDLLSGGLTSRIVKDEGIEPAMAERIVDQALGFLQLCAKSDGTASYGPSEMVDIGWHTLILYTRDYAELCQRVAGRFIHHCPTDEEGVDYSTGTVAQTVAAMKAAGIQVDEELWNNAAKCNNYCTNSCSGTKCTNTGYTL